MSWNNKEKKNILCLTEKNKFLIVMNACHLILYFYGWFERLCLFVTAVCWWCPACHLLVAVLCSKQWWETRPAVDM